MTAAIEAKDGRPSGSTSVASPQAAMAAAAVWTIGQKRGRMRAGSARRKEITPYVLAHRAGEPGAGALRAGPRASPPPSLRLVARAVSGARAVAEALLLLLLLARRARGAVAELDLQRLGLAAAAHGDGDRLAGLVRVHQRGQRRGVLDRLAGHGRDHVAGLQAGARRRGALGDGGDRRARARAVLGRDAEVGVVDLAALHELLDDVVDGVRGDGEADADVARLTGGRGAGALDLRVDADDLAGAVEQRAAGVAGVDGRVGLDDVVDRVAVGRADLALQGGHDAGGQRAVEPEGIADRERRVADLDVVGVAERQ